MDDTAITKNPFQPGDPQYDTWPQSFEPGRDSAVAAFVDAHPEVTQNGAGIWPELEEKDGRNMRRRIVDRDYEARIRRVLGDDLTRVHKHANGATLYFRQRGELRDSGHTILASGMDEKLAAQRIVALGFERGWKVITFTGTGEFIEHAIREALDRNMAVNAKGAIQQAILAKVLSERQGGMGAMAEVGPLPVGAVAADADLMVPIIELDDPAPEMVPTAPQPVVLDLSNDPPALGEKLSEVNAAPKVGVLPMFMNFRERLQERRQQQPAKPADQKQDESPNPPITRTRLPKA